MGARWRESPSLADLRILGEALGVVVLTWLLLGWTPDHAITQHDGSQLVLPYLQGALDAGPDWRHYLYRPGVLGGAAMHPIGGTLPLVQVCAALGLSATATANAITWLAQSLLAYFAIVAIEALATRWTGARVRLDAAGRVLATWLCAFAPVVGWRLGTGHENLILGLLPFLATLALMLAVSAGTLTRAALGIAVLAVAHGVSGYGAQSVVYGAIFGAPLALAAIWLAPPGARWSWDRARALAALAAGVLVVAPRLAAMFAYASSSDAARGLGTSVVYSYSTESGGDLLASLPWTAGPALAEHGEAAHEFNFPFGPLLVVLVVLWPRAQSRRLLWAALLSAVLAAILATHLSPLAEWLLAAVPPLSPFRVPARALLPVTVVVPILALAAWRAATGAPSPPVRRATWIGIALAALVVVAAPRGLAWPREIAAWLGCAALAAAARRAPALFARRSLAAGLAPLAALGVLAFAERIPTDAPIAAIEDGPAQVRAAVLAQQPDAGAPLARVEITYAPLPWSFSTAWAARLGAVDGFWYPTRRYIELLAALTGGEVSVLACVFETWRVPQFPIYQQMYDVLVQVELNGTGSGGELSPLPTPVGPAWFPTRLATVDDAAGYAAALQRAGAGLHDALAGTAWLVASDPVRAPVTAIDPACGRGAVRGVALGEDGQTLTFDVTSPAACVLVVSANYAGMLHARVEEAELAVFPVDVALVGIAVPRGEVRVVLAPELPAPGWATGAAGGGLVVAGAAMVGRRRRRAAAAAAA